MWEKALPSSSVPYDIQVLLPWCEPDTVFFTPNERMARAIEQAYHQWQIEQGSQAWQPLAVRSLNQAMQRWALEYDLVEPLTQDELLYFWQGAIEVDAQQQTDFSWLSSAQAAREACQADELIDHFLLDSGGTFQTFDVRRARLSRLSPMAAQCPDDARGAQPEVFEPALGGAGSS